MLTFKLHTDPGHAWLEVSRALVAELGILEHISPYSYELGPKVYLEEDRDLAIFLEAMNAAGKPCKIYEVYQSASFVRQLPDFRP